ncbi:hypothetical protein A9G48_01625 [Gilliamella sp. wkB18]|uniref:restriction endonuclease subunit S n=1 Tax=Gilliamella sp. wkB18 TaxID=3120260 RepID=UPI00080E0146|nr:restriction endonuclease subunit S [Gilliamella apicola]OCG64723.1 hypothetical protein A9G48_01625 [Gilliamella apicola]
MSESKKLIPKRRFKEFEKSKEFCQIEWQKLVERLTVMSSAHCLPRVEFEDIISEQGELNKDVFKKINDKKGIEFKKGDILFGKLRPYLKNWLYAGFDGIAVGDFWVFRPTFSNGEFIYALIQTNQYQIVANQSTGTKMPRSDWNIVSNTKFIVTTNKIEQTQIGEFFKKLDNLINTQQKKLEKAKTLKSAYLTEMFPNEGELKPRYRFLGFKKDWSITQFKNLANIRRGLTYTPSNLALDGVRILRSSNIDSDRFILRNDDIFIDQSYVSISLVKENDILITSANGSSRLVGKHALIKITNNEKAVHGGFMLLATSNQPFFTNAIMSSNWYRKFLNTYVAGGNGAIGNLNKTELANQDISIPTTLEQTQIGNFFKLLDDKIALEQKKLDKLKNIKQAYLNEMFV